MSLCLHFCFDFIWYSIHLRKQQISEGKESVLKSFRGQTAIGKLCIICKNVWIRSNWLPTKSENNAFDTVKPKHVMLCLCFHCEDLCIARSIKLGWFSRKKLGLGGIENWIFFDNYCLINLIFALCFHFISYFVNK